MLFYKKVLSASLETKFENLFTKIDFIMDFSPYDKHHLVYIFGKHFCSDATHQSTRYLGVYRVWFSPFTSMCYCKSHHG